MSRPIRLAALGLVLLAGTPPASAWFWGRSDTPAEPQTQTTTRARPNTRTVQTCTITHISDGDSFRARCTQGNRTTMQSVRIRSIDAPELKQTYGQQARQALVRLCHNATITVPANAETDRFDRLLLQPECKGVNVAERMVATGMAWVYHHEADQHPQLVSLQKQAQRSGQGLWGQGNPQPPWEWRRQNPRHP